MSDYLVKRLRQPECVYSEDKTIAFWFESTDKFYAADRIEELEKAINDWRKALIGAASDDCLNWITDRKSRMIIKEVIEASDARAARALEGKKDE